MNAYLESYFCMPPIYDDFKGISNRGGAWPEYLICSWKCSLYDYSASGRTTQSSHEGDSIGVYRYFETRVRSVGMVRGGGRTGIMALWIKPREVLLTL